jgi:PKD repeat protein
VRQYSSVGRSVSALALTLSLTSCGRGDRLTEPPPALTLTATVSASPSSGFAPLTVSATSSAGGSAKGPANYHFDFGDGTSLDTTLNQSSYSTPHVYQGGAYTFSVRVEREGLTATATTTVTAENVPPAGRRVTRDRPDEVSGLQVKIVYFTSADGPDRGLDTTGVLQNSVGSFQNWFAGQTQHVVRQDTYGGRLDIVFFKSTMTDAQIAAQGAFVVNELYRQLAGAGFSDPTKRYLIYYDGTSTYACGGAIVDGQAAAMYLKGIPSGIHCEASQFVTSPTAPPGYWEFAMLHDSFHIGGIVDPRAPDHYAPNPYHVNDPADLMHGGPAAWHPSVVDATGHNYYGDNVPEGVRNLKHDSVLIPASATALASARIQTQAVRERPQAAIPRHIHDLVRRLP